MKRRDWIKAAGGYSLLAAAGSGVLALPGCGGGGSGTAPTDGVGTVPDVPASGSGTEAPLASVTVVGGGMAGASVAKYLRLWSGGRVRVTLVERSPTYTSSIMSSMVLTGQRSLASLQYSYTTLQSKYGVRVVMDEVIGLDPSSASVQLAKGGTLTADRLVLAPGIEFDAVPGLTDPNKMPHAWKAGPQTTLLANQLSAMKAGGTVVLTIPPVPYRCPPGPYERACLLADWLRVNKPGATLRVLDANPDIVTEKDNFSRAFSQLYAGIVSYEPGVTIDHVDTASMTLYTNMGAVHGDVVNLIPRQRAGAIVTAAGLNNSADQRFGVVDVLSYASTLAPRTHIIGDSSSTTQPKAGHIANQEGKVCADAILRALRGLPPDPAPVTNSACFSTITLSEASWLTAVFQYDRNLRAMAAVANSAGASLGWNKDNFEDMNTWFKSLMSDTFA